MKATHRPHDLFNPNCWCKPQRDKLFSNLLIHQREKK